MLFESNKDKGRAGMALAIAYFGSNGYTISIPMNDTQWYDLVIEKDGIFQTVQCKATGSKQNEIYLRSCGGTNGGTYDNVLNHAVDYLFCLDQSGNMYVIPVDDIKNYNSTQKTITLRTSPTSNNQGFQTYSYQVKLFNNNIVNEEKTVIKQENKNFCINCNCEISKNATRCHKCASKEKSIPLEEMLVSREELKNLIRNLPFTKIGEKYNITDNSIRKWCKKYSLPTTKKEINSYSDEEWDLI